MNFISKRISGAIGLSVLLGCLLLAPGCRGIANENDPGGLKSDSATPEDSTDGPDGINGVDSIGIPDQGGDPGEGIGGGDIWDGSVPQIGGVVWDFSLPTADGEVFTLSEHVDDLVLLSSFPAAYTQFCTKQNDFIRDNPAEFESRGVLPVGLTTVTVDVLAGWVDEQKYQHMLLSDSAPEGFVSRRLGLFNQDWGANSRSLFLIGRDGTLLYKVGFDRYQEPDFQALFDFVDSLK
ncbi:MAG TPA: redoxin domain-containing protein [Myxococcota bacterium]|nr:redoxin domain-containing protein [Myxococcota bacterium]HOH76763.1 redoxin domain-containing protein [Myxococcota bacterium]